MFSRSVMSSHSRPSFRVVLSCRQIFGALNSNCNLTISLKDSAASWNSSFELTTEWRSYSFCVVNYLFKIVSCSFFTLEAICIISVCQRLAAFSDVSLSTHSYLCRFFNCRVSPIISQLALSKHPSMSKLLTELASRSSKNARLPVFSSTAVPGKY